ncbi:hypothetical protein [Paludisphaera rhizosphaerae]|uniref:hypothetical protein n=1 Tax=Paludisphaera rhizosphaerae TaxID=2711216 RepID=UPI0013EC5EF6|nr:hypothetical protein [Paludisphaera rhizosphaerae]
METSEGDASSFSHAEIMPSRKRSELAEQAAELYRRFHTRCFWHCPLELEITEELIPFVVKGLQTHGGREGFRLAGMLQALTVGSHERQE